MSLHMLKHLSSSIDVDLQIYSYDSHSVVHEARKLASHCKESTWMLFMLLNIQAHRTLTLETSAARADSLPVAHLNRDKNIEFEDIIEYWILPNE